VSLLIEIKLKENLGKPSTDEKEIDEDRSTVLELRTQEVGLFAKVTLEDVVCDWK